MLKLGMLVEFGTLIKSEIAKPKHFLLQDINWRLEICAINFHYFRDGGRVWGVNKGWNRKTETFPFPGHKMMIEILVFYIFNSFLPREMSTYTQHLVTNSLTNYNSLLTGILKKIIWVALK